ncbi:MAG: hypothetical protein PUK67_04740 [Prevotellaceae bacterium]|nr:hypothetical protein [Prevotellaceae bacterium]MDY3364574.1 hypothetical protein [Prevotella sp.]
MKTRIIIIACLAFIAGIAQAQKSEWERISDVPLVQKNIISNKDFSFTYNRDSAGLYLPKIYSFIKPKQLCDGPVHFAFGRKVVTDKWVILHSTVFCDIPKGSGYPYHRHLIAVFTPSGTLVDYLLLKENSDKGFTFIQGIAQPYSLAITYYNDVADGVFDDRHEVTRQHIMIDDTGKIKCDKPVFVASSVLLRYETIHDMMGW